MEHFYKTLGENWFTYPTLYSNMVEKYPTNSHFVEVGTWKGMSAAYMAVEIINSGKDIKDVYPSEILEIISKYPHFIYDTQRYY